MSIHDRRSELRPIGRGTLHTSPFAPHARHDSVRAWARGTRVDAPRPAAVDASRRLARGANAPQR